MPIPTRQAPPVARPRIADEIAQMLEEMIISGALPPGTPLTDEGLAERFGASRTPVREALNLLSAQGFVITVPQRGTTVSPVEPTLFRDAIQVYHSLFALALAEATPLLTVEDAKRLTRTRDTHLANVEAGQASLRHNDISDAFYGVYFDRYNNRVLDQIRARVSPQLRRAFIVFGGRIEACAAESQTIFRELIDASLRGDADAAVEALERHTALILTALAVEETSPTHHTEGS
ncbi:GntR family transcriptional regulator [Mycetocola saprophilus]|uniref:GntR family transcriptional regulator n=1 Tax=Mycetocola saprophilus TaxID=76636 RepID=UPI00068C8BF6|nr:GntR family transcriptional regulator [Mycetocola saprophilus]